MFEVKYPVEQTMATLIKSSFFTLLLSKAAPRCRAIKPISFSFIFKSVIFKNSLAKNTDISNIKGYLLFKSSSTGFLKITSFLILSYMTLMCRHNPTKRISSPRKLIPYSVLIELNNDSVISAKYGSTIFSSSPRLEHIFWFILFPKKRYDIYSTSFLGNSILNSLSNLLQSSSAILYSVVSAISFEV